MNCWLFPPLKGYRYLSTSHQLKCGTRPFNVGSPAQIETHAGPAQKLRASHGFPLWGPCWDPLMGPRVHASYSRTLAVFSQSLRPSWKMPTSRLVGWLVGWVLRHVNPLGHFMPNIRFYLRTHIIFYEQLFTNSSSGLFNP